jgi:16S rRNA processing protein RimM
MNNSNSNSSDWDVAVGRILGAHGLRGLLRVLPLTDVPDRHKTLKRVLVRAVRTERTFDIVSVTVAKRALWLVRLEGIDDRTAAEGLQGATMFIREDELPPLPEGRYYVHQIIGLKVVTVGGRELGTISEVLPTGANDVYVTPAGLLPATDEVIKQVDLQAGTMLVDPLPGMIDEPEDAD